MTTIGHIDHDKPALVGLISRHAARAGIYIVRKTTYDAWRVFNVVTKEWVGNAVEDEGTALGLARRLERGE
ncbi:MAG: hypothetical protein V4498_02820 [candidate division FCPU426 bacterium]